MRVCAYDNNIFYSNPMKKRILHLIWRFQGGGIETFCLNLYKQLIDRYQFEFAVCGPRQEQEDLVEALDCKIYHLPEIKGKSGKKQYLDALTSLLCEEKFDAVHSHLGFMNISTLKIAAKLGIKNRISHTHVAPLVLKLPCEGAVRRFLMRRYATVCIGCSTPTTNFYYGTGNKVKTFYSSIDIGRYYSDNCRKGRKFIIVGRLSPEKSPGLILSIITELAKKDTTYSFIWVGVDECNVLTDSVLPPTPITSCLYSSIRNNLELLIKQHRLLLTGFQSNVDQYLKESDYMLMPSKKEGLGMAAIEAQVSGVYVFASDRLPLDTDLGLISYLPYEMSASQWADEIHNFVMNEMKYSRSLNRKRLQKFDITRIAEQIALFYES